MHPPLEARAEPGATAGRRDRAGGDTGPAPRARAALRSRAELAAGWAFSLPALGLLAVFLVAPFVLAVDLSFTNQRLASPLPTRFVGVDNYLAVLKDDAFRNALRNNVVFAAVVVPVQTAIALGLAVLVNQAIRGIAVFRALFFAPVVMGISVASTVWFLLYDPSQGMVNGLLRVLSWGHLHPAWLQDPSTALPAVMIMSIWASVGFQMVILLAGLQDVPADLYEAAEMDGAGSWRAFVSITLPSIRNTLVFVLTTTTILAFRLFDQVYIMTQGGPLGSTDTMLLQLVKVGYERQQIGRACAIAVVFFVFVVLVTLVQRAFVHEERE